MMEEWQPVYDPSSQLYYYWNTITNETTWTNPFTLDSSISSISSSNAGIDTTTDTTNTNTLTTTPITTNTLTTLNNTTTEYASRGFFNAKTGKFESRPLERNPSAKSSNARANRQMAMFFDYSQWAEERGQKYQNGEYERELEEKKKKPSKKMMEQFKQKQRQVKKKKQAWLFD